MHSGGTARIFQPTPPTMGDRWRARSLAGGWRLPRDWWCPAADALAEAVAEGRDPGPAASGLGRQRAAAGVGLAETLDDVWILCRIGALSPAAVAAVATAVAVSWSEVAVEPATRDCDDPLTGLATPGYLRIRLGELYREAGRSATAVGDTHALVVVGWRSGSNWTALGRPAVVAEAVRAVFSGGETLARLGLSHLVALVNRDAAMAERLGVLGRLLAARVPAAPVQVWLERLPRRATAADWLIDDLVTHRVD